QTRCDCTAGKAHLECDCFIHTFLELRRVSFDFLGCDPHGFFANHISGAIDGINADIHHGSTSGKFFVKSPLAWVPDPKTAETLEEQYFSKSSFIAHPDNLECVRFKMHAISHKQLYVRLPA